MPETQNVQLKRIADKAIAIVASILLAFATSAGAQSQSTIGEIGRFGDWKLIQQKYTLPLETPVPVVTYAFVQKHVVDRATLGRHSVSRPEGYDEPSQPAAADPLEIWIHFEAPIYGGGPEEPWVAELRVRFLQEKGLLYALPVKPPFEQIDVQVEPFPWESGKPRQSIRRSDLEALIKSRPIDGAEVVVLLDQAQASFVVEGGIIELVGGADEKTLTLWTGEGLADGVKEIGWEGLALIAAGQEAVDTLERIASGAPARPQDVPARSGLAKELSAEECFERGARYYEGNGVEVDHAEALLWLTWAARQNHAGAQYYLGRMFQAGHWVVQDAAEAFGWYMKSAEQGLAQGQYMVSTLLWQGAGTAQNQGLAATWLTRSAQQGFAPAATDLAVLYFQGQAGLPADPSRAVALWRQAAEAGHAEAQFNLGVAYANGVGGLSRDLEQARSWFRKAANQGHAKASAAIERLGG